MAVSLGLKLFKKDETSMFIGQWAPAFLLFGIYNKLAGMFLFVLSASGFRNSVGIWTVIGLVSMILLFTLISIPLMEKRNRDRKPGYDEYRKAVPPLLPRLKHLHF